MLPLLALRGEGRFHARSTHTVSSFAGVNVNATYEASKQLLWFVD
jgi:hypothetical protein